MDLFTGCSVADTRAAIRGDLELVTVSGMLGARHGTVVEARREVGDTQPLETPSCCCVAVCGNTDCGINVPSTDDT